MPASSLDNLLRSPTGRRLWRHSASSSGILSAAFGQASSLEFPALKPLAMAFCLDPGTLPIGVFYGVAMGLGMAAWTRKPWAAARARHHHVRLERRHPHRHPPAAQRRRRCAPDCRQPCAGRGRRRPHAPGLRAVRRRPAPSAVAHRAHLRRRRGLSACCSTWASARSSTSGCCSSSGSRPWRSASAWVCRGRAGALDGALLPLEVDLDAPPAPGRTTKRSPLRGVIAAVRPAGLLEVSSSGSQRGMRDDRARRQAWRLRRPAV